jgi:hypothetical protein
MRVGQVAHSCYSCTSGEAICLWLVLLTESEAPPIVTFLMMGIMMCCLVWPLLNAAAPTDVSQQQQNYLRNK